MDRQFALVCSDRARTQHYINRVVDYKNYSVQPIEEEEDILTNALSVMKKIADENRPYEQEDNYPPDYKRTAETEEALAKMDCSEFVSRYLKELDLFDEVPYFTTAEMATPNFIKGNEDKLMFLKGSDKEGFGDIRKGDVFLWRRNMKDHGKDDGHTGVVLSYHKENQIVEVMEALGSSGSRDNSRNQGVCSGCTRVSKYHKEKGALFRHDGWKGYFRPILKQ